MRAEIVSQKLLVPSNSWLPRGKKKMTQNTTSGYPTTATILALAGGIIITLSGVLFVAVSAFVLPNLSYTNLNTPPSLPASSIPGIVSGFVGLMGAFGLVTGAVVLVSSVMLLTNSGQRRTWSVLILVFSALSLVGMGGFIVGAILGIVGGAMVLRWRPPTR
jgi:uncharacterized protein DUF6114